MPLSLMVLLVLLNEELFKWLAFFAWHESDWELARKFLARVLKLALVVVKAILVVKVIGR